MDPNVKDESSNKQFETDEVVEMDEGDEYVPNISQMDYALMDGSGSMGGSSYYDGGSGASAMNSLQQMTSMYGDSPMQQQMMAPSSAHHLQQMSQMSSMYGGGAPLSAAQPPQPAAKAKGRSRKKATASTASSTKTSNTPSAYSAPGAPMQQALPPSYQMMPGGPHMPQNPALMAQARQQAQQRPPQQGGYPPYGNNFNPEQGWTPEMAAAYPGMSQTPQQYRSAGAPGYPPNAAMPPMPPGYPGQQMRHAYFDQHQGAAAGYMGQYPPNSAQASQPRYPTPSGQTQAPQQQAQSTPQPSGQQPYGYMDPNMASYYSQFPNYPQPSSKPPTQQQAQMGHYPDQQSASGNMPGSQMVPQYPQGNSHMQRAPGQPPGWPSNYPNAQSSDGSYWSQQQQQQASQMAFQIQHEIAECERQISAYYQQGQRPESAQRIAHLQSCIHFLRSRMPPNAAQAMTGATTPGSGKPPSDHPHMTPQQYSPTIPPQGGPQMPAQQSAQHPMQRMQADMSRMNNEQKSAVAVMQTAANQVQVNITPEVPGRTLISVYHQYPSPNTSTNVSTSAGMPMIVDSSSAASRDSVPPEPVPSSRSNDKTPATSPTFTKATTFPPLAPASTPSETTPASSTPLMSGTQSGPGNIASTSSFISTPTETRRFTTPPPPHPMPITSARSSADFSAPPMYSVTETNAAATKTHEFAAVADGRNPDQKPDLSSLRQSSNISLKLPSSDTEVDSSTGLFSAGEPKQLVAETELVNFLEEHKIERVENVQHQQRRLSPAPQTQSASDDSMPVTPPQLEHHAASDGGPATEGDEATPSVASEADAPAAADEIETLPMKEEPQADEDQLEDESPTESQIEADTNEEESRQSDVETSVEQPMEESNISVKTEDGTTAAPSISTDNAEPTSADDNEDGATDSKSALMDEAAPSAGDSAAEADSDYVEPAPKSRKKASGSRGRKPAAASSKRKRKKAADDWEDDDNFVAESKKKSRKSEIAQEFEAALQETGLEDFVEKRRSGRKKAEKKSYDEEKPTDFEEEVEEELPNGDAEPVPEKKANDWVVERILGVRTVQKKVKRKKSSASTVKEDAVNGDAKVLPNGDSTKGPPKEEEPESQEQTEAEPEPKPSTSAEGADASGDTLTPELNGIKPDETSKDEDEEEVEEEVEEIYVKYKGRSYLHCAWKSIDELEADDKRILGKINRFKQKYGTSMYDEEEYFNEDFVVVDRVLDEIVDDESGDEYYFIKWRSLPYEECTWELAEDVPKVKISEYRARNKVDSYKLKERDRPDASEWTKIPEDRLYKDDNELRDYQFEGVNWLLFCYYNRQNCILADEMGLGKTVQSICFLQSIYDLGIHGPFLIVVPLSTLHNWEREFETWTDMNAVVYHGGGASREIIQRHEMYYPKNDKKKNIYKFDALITTFEMVVTDCEVLKKINYRVCIIDEAHRLKNRNCKLLTGGLLAFRMEHRVLLTGTPLQNNIQELFSLLNFLEPQQFGNSESFLEQFGQCQTDEQVKKLQDILKPMMLRRLKEDVEKTLQPKEETIIEVQLSNIQKKYYRAILERNFTHLLKGTSAPNLMNAMMELRKCCNHPFLINGAEEQIVSELRSMHPGKSEEELQQISLVQSSGKVVLIEKLLPKLRQDGHKVLVFSQMVKVLDLLEEFLVHMNYQFERIDGNVRGDLRQAAIDRFCKPDSERFVFLLCTRAGGLGINLTAADTVIIFDSDWNPQNDLQAQARCHRIGQTKMVKVYRLITANTYEREMFDRASLKLGLDKAVLQSSTAMKDNGNQLTRKEVEDLLKKGAYGAVMDEDNEDSKFSEEDIETILQRRTQTIRLEPGIKGSTFAKASFTSSSNREDIDVNDPNFWAKWAKKANIEVNTIPEEILHEPRSRRKRFEENYKGLNEGESEEGDGSDNDSGGRGRGDKTRSAKKRRREDDDDYVSYNVPNEFAFNKSEYFKVEKLLTVWGYGRWKAIKENSDLSLSESDMEHISRTLLLHCIREYRGDEKTREFVWRLITPKNGVIGKGGKKGVIGGGVYHEGWAALPEYNPPAFAVDSSFQRHVHRHATKLLTRVHQLQYLLKHIIGDREADILANEKPHKDIQLQVPTLGDPPLAKWDTDCDKSFLFGVFKHGMDNFEAIRSDPLLCFVEKEIEEMPTTMELNTRLKRLIMLYQRQAELRASEALKITRWPKHEEVDFMRVLRVYGVKDDSNSANVINWTRFRELTTCLQKKTDAEMLEQLYCVLAMCTKQQGNELSQVDQRRAACVEAISAQKAEKLMNRLHLMRKIHAIITTGIHHVRTSLKLCSTEHMPSGWGELHDEQLLIIVDKWGLDRIAPRIAQLPAFEKIITPEEKILLRRVVEICTTLETGRWNGIASTEMIEDEEASLMDTMTPQSIAMLQKAVDAAAAAARGAQSRRGRRKNAAGTGRGAAASSSVLSMNNAAAGLDLAEIEKEKMRALMHQSFLQKMEEAAAAMSQNYASAMLPLMGLASGSSGSSSAQQQQLQQLQALLALSALSGATPGTSTASLASVTDDVLNLSKKATPSSQKAAGATATATVTSTKPISCATPSTSANVSSSNPQLSPLNQLNIADLLALANLPVDTNIPVVNTETGQRLTGEKAPKLKHLEQWLKDHPKYKLDMVSISPANASPKPSSGSITKGKSAVSNSLTAPTPPASATVSPKPHVKLEQGEIPKSSATPKPRPSTSSTPASTDNPPVGVFYRNTGIAHPSDKWPTLTNLVAWLDKNPDSNVQTAHIALAKTILPKSYHDRLGGDVISASAASSSTTSTSVLTSTSSASQAATAAAAAAAFGNMSNMQTMETLQLQMLLQQAVFGQSMMAGYNPYASLFSTGATSTSGSNSAANGSAAGLDAATLATLTALMGPQLSQQLTVSPAPSSKAATSTSTPAATAASSSNSNAAATASLLEMSSTEAALAAELLANPSLFSMLNPSAAMSLNPMQAMTGLDMATLAQLSALGATDTASLNSTSSSTQATTSSATRKPGQQAKGLGKLNAVVEKLSSSNSSSEQQS